MDNVIIKCLLESEEYFKKLINFLKPEYFKEQQEKEIFKIIKNYYKKYQKKPSYDVIQMEINDIENKSPEDIDKLIKLIQNIQNTTLEYEGDMNYMIDKTEAYAKDSAMENALLNSVQIMSGENKKQDKSHIPTLLKDALSLSINKSLGHNYFRDWRERYEFYHTDTERVKTDIDALNKMLRGGFPKKSLNIIMSTINVGKTLILSHFSTSFLMQGLNVLYVTLEVSDMRINERIDQNMFDLKNEELIYLDEYKFEKKIFQIKEKTKGNLITLEYPAANITINDISNIVEELEIKEGFIPDILMIDYLALLRSVTFSKFDTLYSFGKNIAEEVRGFATIHNIPIIAPIQTNRGGFGKSDLDMSDVADCIFVDEKVEMKDGNKIKICDLKIGNKIKSHNGLRKVLHIFPIKKKKCYKIKTKSGKSIIVSGEHKFPTQKGKISIDDGLKIGDKLNIKT